MSVEKRGLEVKRFVINPESRLILGKARSAFEQTKAQYPVMSGVGFFGSRTKGMESKESDYDLVFFYNSEKAKNESGLWMAEATFLSRMFFPADKYDILRVDIGEERTGEALQSFVALELLKSGALLGRRGMHMVGDTSLELMSRFFLAVGDEIYQSRLELIRKFEAIDGGEGYFAGLMRRLANFERDNNRSEEISVPMYQRYPQTTSEAKEYFGRFRKSKKVEQGEPLDAWDNWEWRLNS